MCYKSLFSSCNSYVMRVPPLQLGCFGVFDDDGYVCACVVIHVCDNPLCVCVNADGTDHRSCYMEPRNMIGASICGR